MNSVVQERLSRLDDILDTRRKQVGFRLGIAVAVILFYSASLGLGATLSWAAVYGLMQLAEHSIFTPRSTARLIGTRLGYAGALALVATNTVVFGSLSLIWPWREGSWGVSNAALLLAGAMLNSVLTTQASKAAFLASTGPLLVYAAILPLSALTLGCDLRTVMGLSVGAVLMSFTAIKLWREAHRIRIAEKIARADAERRRAEAESAVAAKSAFVAMVSHELRTPISAILAGATELERISGGVGRSHARLISDAGSMMRTLLNDLLDLAKLDAGRMSVESVPYDFRALMADQLRFWRAEALKKGVALRLAGAKNAPAWVEGDPTRLRQVLNNLISNALKFTDHGAVTVSIDAARLPDGRAKLAIEIADTGSGMTPAQLDKLFQPFVQADASIARTHGGTGLGLVISRELTRMMGGDITACSTHGEGSCFSVAVVVGLAEPVAPAASNDPAHGTNAISVLVVDDHEVNRRALSLMLEPLSAEVTLAASAAEALAHMAVRPFDVVLMDVHMPNMSGREAVTQLRLQAGPNRATPVIAVTGATEAADVQACLAAGMNDWVAKPIDAGQLYNALARQLTSGEANQEAAAA